MNNSHDPYDQYADQLLNSVFANVQQVSGTTPHIPDTNHEDLLLNQLFQNARISSPAPSSPFLNKNNSSNNELLLLQQLQQQQQLIEKQLSAIASSRNSVSPVFQVPVVESSATCPSSSSELVANPKPKKIVRVPVQQQQVDAPAEYNDAALVKATAAAAADIHHTTNRPALPKKKSFLRRTLSRKNFKDRETVAPTSTTAATTKSVQPKAAKQQPIPTPVVEKSPTFWKPREERPKGWWKGARSNSTATEQQPYYHYEENQDVAQEEEETSSEEEVPVPVPVKKTKKKVVKRVVVPQQQKVPSIKKKTPRPMAFKSPTIKAKKKKNKVKEASAAATKSRPMYAMPQQPMYYQQPMMMPSQQPYMMPGQFGNGYYGMPGQGTMMMSPSLQQNETRSNKTVPTRKKTVLNPREATNDKCSIM